MNIKQLKENLENIKIQTPDIYKDSMNITIPFFLLSSKLFEHGEKMLKEKYNLNQTELDILSLVYYSTDEKYRITPTKLYDMMLFSSGGMTKALKKLESKDYIKRVENENDKRSKLVELTSLGKEIAVKAIKDIVEFEDKSFSKLDKQEQQLLSKLLLKALY